MPWCRRSVSPTGCTGMQRLSIAFLGIMADRMIGR
jgi:hypothetical protein